MFRLNEILCYECFTEFYLHLVKLNWVTYIYLDLNTVVVVWINFIRFDLSNMDFSYAYLWVSIVVNVSVVLFDFDNEIGDCYVICFNLLYILVTFYIILFCMEIMNVTEDIDLENNFLDVSNHSDSCIGWSLFHEIWSFNFANYLRVNLNEVDDLNFEKCYKFYHFDRLFFVRLNSVADFDSCSWPSSEEFYMVILSHSDCSILRSVDCTWFFAYEPSNWSLS